MFRILRALPRRTILVLMIGGALLTPACQLLDLNMPRVKNHPQPEISPIAVVFDDSSCPEENGRQTCIPEGALEALGCEEVRPPGQVLDGLQPAYPLRLCLAAHQPGERLVEGEFIYHGGCLMSEYIRYVVIKDGGFVLLKSLADLQQAYAPIESEDEALSYALAASGLGVRYGLTSQPDLRYFVDQLEDTHVETVPQGYQVRLFDYKLCGCGPHPTYAVDVLVTSGGQLRELKREKIYEDPAEDNLCVD
jgi:hypothetical protein